MSNKLESAGKAANALARICFAIVALLFLFGAFWILLRVARVI